MSDDLSGFSLMELFRLEAESQTAILSSGVLAIEAGAISLEMLEPLMRAAHSLKGAARIVGVETAIRVAHALEDLFVAAQKGTLALRPEHGDALLRAVDLLGLIAQLADDQLAIWQTEHEPAVAAMVADLNALLHGPPPPPVAATVAVEPEVAPAPADHATGAPPPPAERAVPVAEPSTATAAATTTETAERVVRVTADSLSRLLGLAGESLIQSRQLPPLVDALRDLRNRQTLLIASLNLLEERAMNEHGEFTHYGRELIAPGPGRCCSCSRSCSIRSRRSRTSPGGARISPAGCTTRS